MNPRDFDLAGHTHSAQFYSDDNFLVDVLSHCLGDAVGKGDAAIVIATQQHRGLLGERLAARGIDVEEATAQGRYVALDAHETLAQFMIDGWPDEGRFFRLVGSLIAGAKAAAKNANGRVVLFSEMVALLWEAEESKTVLRVEQLWNQVALSQGLSLVCAYPLAGFCRLDHEAAFTQICDEHTAVFPDERYTQASNETRLRRVARWQQRALALESEMQRRESNELAVRKLAAIVESSADAIVSKNLDGIVSSWNAAAEQMFGYTAKEMIGRSITTIIPPELRKEEDGILERIRRGERISHYETVRLAKSGRRLEVSLTVFPLHNDAGKVIGAAKIARDISTQKRAQEALGRAEKLAVTGRMALTIAHEINNPLESVTNALFLLRNHIVGDEGAQYLALAETELARVAEITKQTLRFYRERATPETVNMVDLVDETLSMFARKITAKRIMFIRRDVPVTVLGLKGELRQLFSNLLDNALDAVPANGIIKMSIDAVDGKAVVTITDNGPGIRPEHVARIFEPFFTTKESLGTGLGLWLAQEIAKRHQGTITVEAATDDPGRGTTFRVALCGIPQPLSGGPPA